MDNEIKSSVILDEIFESAESDEEVLGMVMAYLYPLSLANGMDKDAVAELFSSISKFRRRNL